MSIPATIINCNKILKEKYNISMFDYSEDQIDEYFDEESFHDDGNEWWSRIWRVGNRYFKFNGLNEYMDEDCHEMLLEIKLVPTNIWKVKDPKAYEKSLIKDVVF